MALGKGVASALYISFALDSSAVLRLNFCAKNRKPCKAAKS